MAPREGSLCSTKWWAALPCRWSSVLLLALSSSPAPHLRSHAPSCDALCSNVPRPLHRLGRCTAAITGEDGDLPRVKPFKYAYEKEIVMYAYFKK